MGEECRIVRRCSIRYTLSSPTAPILTLQCIFFAIHARLADRTNIYLILTLSIFLLTAFEGLGGYPWGDGGAESTLLSTSVASLRDDGACAKVVNTAGEGRRGVGGDRGVGRRGEGRKKGITMVHSRVLIILMLTFAILLRSPSNWGKQLHHR